MNNPDEYFNDNDMLEGITLKDPSKMRFEELHAICTLWLTRQEQGKPAFQFKNVFPKHQREEATFSRRKGKAKAIQDYMEIDDDLNLLNVIEEDVSAKVGESSR
jgi:hypothetical protein